LPEEDRQWRGGTPGDGGGSDRDTAAGRGWLADPRATIARRDLASLGREKTIVLALLIQLFIAAFSSFLVVGLTSLYDPGSVEGGDVTVGITGEAAGDLQAVAAEQGGVTARAFADRETALAAFDRGAVDAVFVTTTEPGERGSRVDVVAVVPAENLRTTFVVVQIREVLTAFERTERLDRATNLEFQPVELPADVGASPYFGFTYTILIPLLLFLPPFISGSVAVDAITEEIERGTLELLRVAPVSLVDILDGKAAAMVVLAPAQAALWIVLLTVNGIAVGNVIALLAFVTAVAVLTVVLGLVLGLVTARRRQAQLLYSVFVIVLFGLAVALPEHPATTVAKLAVDSPTLRTFAHVAGFLALAVALYAATRRFAGRLDPESLA
jgi:ABC-type Na+ efflux pump permease subunit